MIDSERQYQATKERMSEFEEALAHAEDRASERHPLYQQVLRKNLEDELYTVYEALSAFERRSGGESEAALLAVSDLPTALIRARIQAELRQVDLANRLGLTEQQVRDYEARRYDDVAPELLRSIAEMLGVHLPDAATHDGNPNQSRRHQPA